MELINITHIISSTLSSFETQSGILYLFNPHTTAGLTINEGADPDVCRDLIAGLRKMVPDDIDYRHAEGNSPAHIMTTLTGSSLTLPFENGKLILGTWQQVFFCEFDGPRTRKVSWRILF